MFYFYLSTDKKVSKVSEEYVHGDVSVCRHDFKTFTRAEEIAAQCNELNDGNTYVATDAGPWCSPQFDVITIPKVGDEVSYAFNGDYYPCGKVVSVGTGAKRVVVTDTGAKFYRRKLTGSWLKEGGTWSLVAGHRSERNPSF